MRFIIFWVLCGILGFLIFRISILPMIKKIKVLNVESYNYIINTFGQHSNNSIVFKYCNNEKIYFKEYIKPFIRFTVIGGCVTLFASFWVCYIFNKAINLFYKNED